jgi:RNA polymerase sigma-70 factor (ECF subfamily)
MEKRRTTMQPAIQLEAEPKDSKAVTDPAMRMDLQAAIAALSDGQRTVFLLHDMEGYTHEEIGSLLGIEPGTSKSQLSHARRLLRSYLM